MIDYLTLKPKAFGIDISDLSLKIVKLKNRGKFFNLVSFGETVIKPGIIEQGEVKNKKVLIENIRRAVKKVNGEKIKTQYVIVSLPEEKAFLQVIHLPFMTAQEAKKAVYFEAENYIPLPINEVYLDSQIISYDAKTNKLNILIVALPKTIVDPYVSSLRGAGLKPLAFEIESMSISRALVNESEAHKPLILIDLGENRTGFSIFCEHSLRFTTTHQDICAKKFTEAIAESLKISFKEAETLKLKKGIINNRNNKKISDILMPSLIELVNLIKKYISYCETRYNQKIDKVLLCGGGANLKGLVDFLGQQLKTSVELGNPWINIVSSKSKEHNLLSHEESLRYTTAIGLALRGEDHD